MSAAYGAIQAAPSATKERIGPTTGPSGASGPEEIR
jgi:hypothetical protein